MHEKISTGIGIVNPYGDLWSDEVYQTPEAAVAYLQKFWADKPGSFDISLWKLIPVKKTVAPMTVYVEAHPANNYPKTPA